MNDIMVFQPASGDSLLYALSIGSGALSGGRYARHNVLGISEHHQLSTLTVAGR